MVIGPKLVRSGFFSGVYYPGKQTNKLYTYNFHIIIR